MGFIWEKYSSNLGCVLISQGLSRTSNAQSPEERVKRQSALEFEWNRPHVQHKKRNFEKLDKLFVEFPEVKWDADLKSEIMKEEKGAARRLLSDLRWVFLLVFVIVLWNWLVFACKIGFGKKTGWRPS